MYWLLSILLTGPLGAGAQVATWTKLARSASNADFMARLQPAPYGLTDAPLASLQTWQANSRVQGDSLYQLLRGWNRYPKPRRTGVICHYTLLLDSAHSVPYLVYVPQHYNHQQPTKLLVYYKGGWMNRKELPADYAREIVTDNPTFSYLDEQNTIEIFPCLRRDLAIFGFYGYAHLQHMIAQTKRLFNIDDNRVYLSGFSDGGKTVFNVASLTPSAFASFYAINGPLVSRPDFANLPARPLLALISGRDEVVNPTSVYSYAQQARRLGADWQVRRLPGRAHYYPPYQQEVIPLLFAHLQQTSRNPFPTRLTYYRSFNDAKTFPGLDWLQIQVNQARPPRAGHQRDSVQVINLRGEALDYVYGDQSGQVRATCFDNTYTLETSLLDAVTVYISPLMIDVSQPIRVVINGQERYQGKIGYSKSFLLQRFRATHDRQQLFINEVTIKL